MTGICWVAKSRLEASCTPTERGQVPATAPHARTTTRHTDVKVEMTTHFSVEAADCRLHCREPPISHKVAGGWGTKTQMETVTASRCSRTLNKMAIGDQSHVLYKRAVHRAATMDRPSISSCGMCAHVHTCGQQGAYPISPTQQTMETDTNGTTASDHSPPPSMGRDRWYAHTSCSTHQLNAGQVPATAPHASPSASNPPRLSKDTVHHLYRLKAVRQPTTTGPRP